VRQGKPCLPLAYRTKRYRKYQNIHNYFFTLKVQCSQSLANLFSTTWQAIPFKRKFFKYYLDISLLLQTGSHAPMPPSSMMSVQTGMPGMVHSQSGQTHMQPSPQMPAAQMSPMPGAMMQGPQGPQMQVSGAGPQMAQMGPMVRPPMSMSGPPMSAGQMHSMAGPQMSPMSVMPGQMAGPQMGPMQGGPQMMGGPGMPGPQMGPGGPMQPGQMQMRPMGGQPGVPQNVIILQQQVSKKN